MLLGVSYRADAVNQKLNVIFEAVGIAYKTIITPELTWKRTNVWVKQPYAAHYRLWYVTFEADSANTAPVYIDNLEPYTFPLGHVSELLDPYDWRLKVRNDENLANLDVGLSTRASEASLVRRLPRKIELDDGTGVYKEIYRTNNALRTFVQNLLTVRGYTDFDITTTAEATTEVIPAPATGYKIRLFDIHFASTADIITALRFGATGDLMWALPTIGAISKNLINRERDAPEATGLYVYTSDAGRVIGTIGYEVVSV